MSAGHDAPSLGALRSILKSFDDQLASLELAAQRPGPAQTLLLERRIDQVIDLSGAIFAAHEVSGAIAAALERLLPLMRAERAMVVVYDKGRVLGERLALAHGGDERLAIRFARPLADRALETGRPVAVAELGQDAALAAEAAAHELAVGSLLAAVGAEGDLKVALYVDRRPDQEGLSGFDLKTLQALATLVARAVGTAQRSAAERERQSNLEMVNRLYQAISRTLELDQVLDHVAQIALDVTKAERAFILLRSTGGQLSFAAGRDANGPLPPTASREISRSVVEKVLETQAGVHVFDTANSAEFGSRHSVVSLKLNAVVAVPLLAQGGLSGVLYIDSRTRSMDGLERELAVLTAIANVASLAVENAKLYRQATVDGLTGLYARSFFMMRLEEEARRAARYQRPLSLLVLDIDHFKKVNDTYGHQTGDEVIRHVSKALRTCIRTGVDMAGRYGGEELVALLPETAPQGGLILAERIRMAIAEVAVPGPGKTPLSVTVSVGVAGFPEMATTTAQLFERADQALYHAKQNGRNRATLYHGGLAS